MLLDRYLDHLTYEKRYSAHTVAAYGRDLRQFQEFLTGLGLQKLEEASDRIIRSYLMHLMSSGVGPRSINRKLSTLRGFYRFARMTNSIATEPTALIEPPRTARRLPEFVEERRMEELFTTFEWPQGHNGLLHRVVMELLYGTGMRLAELLGLRLQDLDIHGATLRVLGKRNKERMIPLAGNLTDLLRQYLQAREAVATHGNRTGHLLLNERGEPLARRSVQRLVAAYLGGVTTQQKRSPHVLRHTFATHMLEHGADLNAVKELLGHANLAATQVYTHNTVEKLRRVHAQAHPRGGSRE